MLRNLLYSLVFHLLLSGILVLSTLSLGDIDMFAPDNITQLTISFLSENSIEDLHKVKTSNEDERVKKLSLDEKIELYNKVKALKKIQRKKEELTRTGDFSVGKPTGNTNVSANTENEFSYYYTPVYVAESRIDTEEKRKILEDRLKKEELRKKIKEKNIVGKIPVELNTKPPRSLDDVIKLAQKPLVIKKEVSSNKKSKDNQASYAGSTVTQTASDKLPSRDVDDLVTEINIEVNKIDSEYEGITEDTIFNESDYQKLKEINDSGFDTRNVLSIREKRNVQRQIKGCYKMAILKSKRDSKAIIAVTVRIGIDGIVNINTVKAVKISTDSDKTNFDIALDNAKSALVFCNPLRGLPITKYKAWKHMTFIFDSSKI